MKWYFRRLIETCKSNINLDQIVEVTHLKSISTTLRQERVDSWQSAVVAPEKYSFINLDPAVTQAYHIQLSRCIFEAKQFNKKKGSPRQIKV